MSQSAALQKFIYETLTADSTLDGLIDGRVYDRAQPDAAFPFISFGASDFVPVQDDCLVGREENFQIDIWSDAKGGKRVCKQITDQVAYVLNGIEDTLDDGYATDIRVTLVRVMDDPDGITSHGVVQIQALVDG